MTTALAPALAGAAAAVLVGVPAGVRLRVVLPHRLPPRPWSVSEPPRWLPALVCAALGLVVDGVALAVVTGVAAFCGQQALRRRRSTAAAVQERRRAVEACTVLAGELHSGRSPAEALRAAEQVASGQVAAAFGASARAAALGEDVPAALSTYAAGSSAPALLRGLSACWAVCGSSGGGVAAAVERMEQTLRGAEAQRQALEAELAGPRATAGMLAILPLAGLALAGALGAHPVHVLLHTPLGLVAATAGLTLDVLGLVWTQWLVRRAAGAV